MYTNILHGRRDAVRRKRPPKWRLKRWFLLNDKAAAHWSVLVNYFLAQNSVQHWSFPHTLLTWLKLIFTCSLK